MRSRKLLTLSVAFLLLGGLPQKPTAANEWDTLDRSQEDLQDYGHPIKSVRTNYELKPVRAAVDRLMGRQWPSVRLALRTIGDRIPKYVPGRDEDRIDELASTMTAYRKAFLRWREDVVAPETDAFDRAIEALKQKLDRTPEGENDDTPADLSGVNERIEDVRRGLVTMRGILAEMPRKLRTLLQAWAQLEGQRARAFERANEQCGRTQVAMRDWEAKGVDSMNRAHELRSKARVELKRPSSDRRAIDGYLAAADRAEVAADRIMEKASKMRKELKESLGELRQADQAQEQVSRMLETLSERVFDI